jgi:hypothetical protein
MTAFIFLPQIQVQKIFKSVNLVFTTVGAARGSIFKLVSMLSIIDKYILKDTALRPCWVSFILSGLLLMSQRGNKMIENKVPLEYCYLLLSFYIYFFANSLFPIFLFLSIIWFTSKLANNTEIMPF